jgi:hypothetical protein
MDHQINLLRALHQPHYFHMLRVGRTNGPIHSRPILLLFVRTHKRSNYPIWLHTRSNHPHPRCTRNQFTRAFSCLFDAEG